MNDALTCRNKVGYLKSLDPRFVVLLKHVVEIDVSLLLSLNPQLNIAHSPGHVYLDEGGFRGETTQKNTVRPELIL